MSKVDLTAFVSRALNGDNEALGELMAALRAVAFKAGSMFSRSARAWGADGKCFAEDLASDVMLKILRAPLQELTEIENLQGWVWTVATHQALNSLRALQRQRIVSIVPPSALGDGEYDALAAHLEQLAAPTEDLILNFDLDRELVAFAARGPEQRKRLSALVSHTLGGTSQRQLARVAGVRRETVIRWIKSAKEQLRQALTAHGVIGPGGRVRKRRKAAKSVPALAVPVRRKATSRRLAA